MSGGASAAALQEDAEAPARRGAAADGGVVQCDGAGDGRRRGLGFVAVGGVRVSEGDDTNETIMTCGAAISLKTGQSDWTRKIRSDGFSREDRNLSGTVS